MQAVLLVGGLGTRLRPLTNDTPKPMVRVRGKPFLEYVLKLLKGSGVKDYVFCVGYLSNVVTNYFGDGRSFGVNISYSYEEEGQLLGPAGALKQAQGLVDDVFFVTYGDSYLNLNYGKVMEDFLRPSEDKWVGKLGMMVVYKNSNEYGKSDIVISQGLVSRYDKRNQTEDMVWINFGLSVLRKGALACIPKGRAVGEEEFYGELIKRRELRAYETSERFYEIGTPESLSEFEKLLVGTRIV